MARPNYEEDLKFCKEFLAGFRRDESAMEEDEEELDPRTYVAQMQNIANRKSKTLNIDLGDVQAFAKDPRIYQRMCNNTSRYLSLFAEAADTLIPDPSVPLGSTEVSDILAASRTANARANATAGAVNPSNAANRIPAALLRRFQVFIVPPASINPVSLRQIRAADIGKLIKVEGVVTRVSEVKPRILVASYLCDGCGNEIYQDVATRTYMPLSECPSEQCKTNKSTGSIHPMTRASKFIKFQEMRIQELSDQVPVGMIPRVMTVHVHGDMTRSCVPGDRITLSAIYTPTPPTGGFRVMRQGLVQEAHLDATGITKQKKAYSDHVLTDDLLDRIQEFAAAPDPYFRLANSIAPEIYGHDDVKRALLLLLVGGVTRNMSDGMRIRGDINICLMGDPGVAKSQLLKAVSKVAPRSVYTTGRSSSGAGLTAAVIRDKNSGDVVLEGGALVLADMGVCCIDEFDKMDEIDRTAIHEVMEQQSVSIAKAGITTSLNARASVLAAANPAYGRYNPNISASANINLPASLLSRFDLLYLILDKADLDRDRALAFHVLEAHQDAKDKAKSKAAKSSQTPDSIPIEFLREYISQAKRIDPWVPPELTEYIVNTYSGLRQEQAKARENGASSRSESMRREADHTYVTPRALLSILRLSQSLARLRFSTNVTDTDVQEAIRLMNAAKSSLYEHQADGAGGSGPRTKDTLSTIYELIKSVTDEDGVVNREKAKIRVLSQGFSDEDLQATIAQYTTMGVLLPNADTGELRFT